MSPIKSYILSLALIIGSHAAMILNQIARYYPDNVDIEAATVITMDDMMETMYVVNNADMTIDVVMMEATYDDDNTTITGIDFMKNVSIEISLKEMSVDEITSIQYDANNDMVYCTVVPTTASSESSPGYLVAIDASTNEISKSMALNSCYTPQHFIMTKDSKMVFIACSGEEADYTNPEIKGSINMVNTTSWMSMNYDLSDIGDNTSVAIRENTGIYRYYQSSKNVSFAIEAEPEYVSMDMNETRLYVTLQETNAVAIFDLDAMKFIELLGLGFKSYSMNGGLDASDMDGGINIKQYYGVYGMRQPSQVEYYYDSATGNTYFISINEGESKGFDGTMVGNITLNATVFEKLYANSNMSLDDLVDDAMLGRLMISRLEGDRDGYDEEFEGLYTFGSRDFSVYKLNDAMSLTLMYESNDTFEQTTASELGKMGFNSQAEYAPSNDTNSPLNGPKPDASVYGTCYDDDMNAINLLFIASESVGGIFVYDITDINDITLMEYMNNRNFMKYHYNEGERPLQTAGDVGIEQLKFIGSDEMGGGQALLLSVNEISSSVTVYSVNCSLSSTPSTTADSGGSSIDETTEKLVILILAIVFGVVLLAGIVIFIYFKCFEGPRQKIDAPKDYVELQ